MVCACWTPALPLQTACVKRTRAPVVTRQPDTKHKYQLVCARLLDARAGSCLLWKSAAYARAAPILLASREQLLKLQTKYRGLRAPVGRRAALQTVLKEGMRARVVSRETYRQTQNIRWFARCWTCCCLQTACVKKSTRALACCRRT
jgi:hypothetical protein